MSFMCLASGSIGQGSGEIIQQFLSLDESEQRNFLDDSNLCDKLMRTLISIVEKIYSDNELTYWALALLNGIIEDLRTRIKNLEHIEKTKQPEVQKNCIHILYSFLQQNTQD